MKIKVYPLYEYAVAIQPAHADRAWLMASPILAKLPLNMANNNGWELLCPYRFEAIWHGGEMPADIEITPLDVAPDVPSFVVSQVGHGILTFHSGYQLKTEPAGNNLWLQGPVNQPKDGLYPLSMLLETFRSPHTIAMHWQFTRPHVPIYFEAGEPFATFFPYPANYVEAFSGEVVSEEESLADMEHFMVTDPALQAELELLVQEENNL